MAQKLTAEEAQTRVRRTRLSNDALVLARAESLGLVRDPERPAEQAGTPIEGVLVAAHSQLEDRTAAPAALRMHTAVAAAVLDSRQRKVVQVMVTAFAPDASAVPALRTQGQGSLDPAEAVRNPFRHAAAATGSPG